MDLYTTISMTGQVATLMNRDAILSASVSAGTTILPIGDSYMDRDTSTIVVFPAGGMLSVGTESLTVVGTPPSATSITITPALSNSYPIYTPVLRTDYYDVATDYGTPSTPGTIRVGMEEVSYSTIDVGTNRIRFYIDSRGENAYPHTEWSPVTDATHTVNNPATDSEIGRWGVIEAVDYHHGALDHNTLDLHAYDKLMEATRPEFGRVEMTGMDVWQDAPYGKMKALTFSLPATETPTGRITFSVYKTDGTDTATSVYVGATSLNDTWWDMRFAYPTDTVRHLDHTITTFSTVGATVMLYVKDVAFYPSTVNAVISDSFDDNVIDPAWNVSTITAATENGGSLNTYESSTDWNNWDNAVTRTVSITGDFTAVVDITVPSGGYIFGVYFMLVSQSGKSAYGGINDSWAAGGPMFHANVTGGVEYSSGQSSRTVPYSGTVTISRSGSTVSVYEGATLRVTGTIPDTITTVKLVHFNYYNALPIIVNWKSVNITEPVYHTATVNFYYGCPIAIDRNMPRIDNYTALQPVGWSSVSTGPFDIGDRGFATVREGDLVTVVDLDGATRDYRVSGMIYDQRAGKLTMEIGKPYEGAITDLVKPFRTRDILSTKNL